MLPIKKILKDPILIETQLRTKDPSISLKELINEYHAYTEHLSTFEKLKEKLNTLSKEVGVKKQQKEDCSFLIDQVSDLKVELKEVEEKASFFKDLYEAKLSSLPNLPDPKVKVSLNPEENECIKIVGEKPSFTFPIKNHLEIGEKNNLFLRF